MNQIINIVQKIHKENKLYCDKKCPFPFHVETNNDDSKITVITGDNASGKSLFVKDFKNCAKKFFGIKPIVVSIRERLNPSSGNEVEKRRIFSFNDESNKSTGVSSLEIIKKSLSTLAQWGKEDKTMLILDEPETGLAQNYEYALGQYIADNMKSLQNNPNIAGIVIVSHSKNLVKGIYESGCNMSFVYMGKEPLTVNEWINSEDRKTVDDLILLMEKGNKKYDEVEAISQKYKRSI